MVAVVNASVSTNITDPNASRTFVTLANFGFLIRFFALSGEVARRTQTRGRRTTIKKVGCADLLCAPVRPGKQNVGKIASINSSLGSRRKRRQAFEVSVGSNTPREFHS
jgi:hypothetical protein